ncbi:hypothetical protein DCAR_0832129 [Daucus carota subsp. sativus]|uniref:ZF-HD dimerization-type domain-containing protein n=1 Tax=Daucus carota subsp. sativus TaxID=79200 RepID=A0A175YNI1_DAUCS|nr:PREDICTED: zinc-finger homeodomain protein 1 [Daucus carota subsp. sativus]WOH12623.1 hypothetical protein DCAR_0832129 [Daucus carota subsp. sativus]
METNPKLTSQTSDPRTTNINNAHPIPRSLISSSHLNKKHHQQHIISYKECLKNHAVSIGGHALDGCGEFMPSTHPNSLKCAACGCHRNFHRREADEPDSPTPHFLTFRLISTLAPDEHKHRHHAAENASSRKRLRTRFSREQKERMRVFAEKLGWRMHKSDEVSVEEFCKEIGVGKSVLKVWMHNNKTTLGKRDDSSNNVAARDGNIGGGEENEISTQHHL